MDTSHCVCANYWLCQFHAAEYQLHSYERFEVWFVALALIVYVRYLEPTISNVIHFRLAVFAYLLYCLCLSFCSIHPLMVRSVTSEPSLMFFLLLRFRLFVEIHMPYFLFSNVDYPD